MEITYLWEKTHFFRDQHKNMEVINAALRKIKYRGNKSWLNICSPKKTWHEPQQWTGSLRSLTSSPPPLGEINMSHPLFSCRWLLHIVQCTSTSTQAERVFSWMGFLLNKRRLSLSGGESVTKQLFLNDNLELWVDVCLIPRWDDNKLWYPHIASKLICFPGDIFVLIGFVIIGG